MIVKLLTEHHLEFLSLEGGCRGSSESTHVKMSTCWKSHAAAHLCFCLVSFLMLSRLFIAALWSSAGKGLTAWLLLVMFIVILLLSHVVSWCQVWYLIVSFPDLCRLSYFTYKERFIAWHSQCLSIGRVLDLRIRCLLLEPKH